MKRIKLFKKNIDFYINYIYKKKTNNVQMNKNVSKPIFLYFFVVAVFYGYEQGRFF